MSRPPARIVIEMVPALDSTSDEALRRIRAGAVSGESMRAIVAVHQRAGRGRRGRRWASRVGNLHMTLVLPAPAPERIGELAFLAAVAAGEAVAAHLPPGRLAYKWPNDLMCAGRKLGGILVETETAPAGARFAAIGIGINVADAPEELNATSLVAERADIAAAGLAEAVAGSFESWHARWRAQGFAPVRANWMAGAQGIGARLVAELADGAAEGRFAGIDEAGRLVLEQAAGPLRIAVAEIRAA